MSRTFTLALPFLAPTSLFVAISFALIDLGGHPFLTFENFGFHALVLAPVLLLLVTLLLTAQHPDGRLAVTLLGAIATVWLILPTAEILHDWVLPRRWPGFLPVVADLIIVGYSAAVLSVCAKRLRAA